MQGKYIKLPTAADIALDRGISGFRDNRLEVEERLKIESGEIVEEEDDDSKFWFSF